MLVATQSEIAAPSSSQISTVYAPAGLAGNFTWRLINDADGTIVIAESSNAITEVDDGHDASLRRYQRAYTAPSVGGSYLAIWRLFEQEEQPQTIVVSGSRDSLFASVDDVAARRGALTDEQMNVTVPFLLTAAAAAIADAAGYDDGWAAALNPVPNMLRFLSVELVCRALANPSQWSQIRQQVGSYSFSATQDTPGMVLSDAEVMMVRRTVHGRTTDSTHLDSGFQRAQDEYWLRKQALRLSDPNDPGSLIP